MTVTLRDARLAKDDREWIRGVYPEYLADLRASRNVRAPALHEWGIRDDEPLADWFSDYSAHPLVILDAGRRVGFALVTRSTGTGIDAADYRMSEFFVQQAARRCGVGGMAAALIFSRYDGRWEVLEDEHNLSAVQFWRRVIGELTAGRYREARRGGEIRQSFDRAAPYPAPG